MSGTRITFSDGSNAWTLADDASEGLSRWYQEKLAAFHKDPVKASCKCQVGHRALRLIIRRLTNGRYILTRMPNEGPLHREACPFHGMDTDRSGRAGYADGVIAEASDGGIRVRLDQTLALRGGAPAQPPPASGSGRNGSGRQAAMTPLGLLNLLWEIAGLDRWHPGFRGRRPAWLVAARLERAAETVRIAKTDLSDCLTAMAEDRRSGERLRQQVASIGSRHKLVVVAPVLSIEPAMKGTRNVRLAGGMAAGLYMSGVAQKLDIVEKRFPYAARLLAQRAEGRTGRVIGIFLVSAQTSMWKGRPAVWAKIEDAALMEVSQDHIPVASELERQVADHLVREDRAFVKPLRFDAAADLVLPDFVLTDTDLTRGYPMEVFGRADAAYQNRQAAKESYYQNVYGLTGWWKWQATGPLKTDMPSLPAPTIKS